MKSKLIYIIIVFAYITQAFASGKDEPKSSAATRHDDSEKGVFTGAKDFNLLSNSGFENKTSKWLLGKYNGGSGLFTTDTINPINDSQSALVITDNVDQKYNDVQLFTFFNLKKQSGYEIVFDAEVNTTCEVSISVSNGFEIFYEAKFKLQPGKNSYGPFSFVGKQNDQFSYFSFNLGKTKAQIRVDDVIIRADHTKREFDEMISRSGFNIHFNQSENLIHISSPTVAQSDMPILLYDPKKNVINTHKIRQGSKEANITLNKAMGKGSYLLKVFTGEGDEDFNFTIN